VGKRIEDLRKLDDSPIERQVEALEAREARRLDAATDDRHQPWYAFVGTINDLLVSGDYDWAVESLEGIKATVERTQRVTEGQERAISNIAQSRQDGRPSRQGRRRYEGFPSRGR
jgi:hypothetical protein